MFLTTALTALLAVAGAPLAAPPAAAVHVEAAHPQDVREQATVAQLQRLIRSYDLDPWLFTHDVRIDRSAIPHSHPVLTLHTRHLKDDDLLLSTFVHEELHWYLVEHSQGTDAAIADLKARFPKTPVGFPLGSSDETGNYVHLLDIFLEWRADRMLLGELRARQVMEFWAADHYTWVYRTVLEHEREIGEIVSRHGLMYPAPRKPPAGNR